MPGNGALGFPRQVVPSGTVLHAYRSKVTTNHNPTPTVPTDITGLTASIVGTGVERTVLVSFCLVHDNHAMRSYVTVNGVQEWPKSASINSVGNSDATGGPWASISAYCIPVVLPPGGGTISVTWESQGSTAGINIIDRQLVVTTV